MGGVQHLYPLALLPTYKQVSRSPKPEVLERSMAPKTLKAYPEPDRLKPETPNPKPFVEHF